jgi:hypothetical protein
MEEVKSSYADLISLTRYRPHYDVIDFEKFIRRQLGMKDFFLSGKEIAAIRKILKDRKIIEQNCFTQFGQIETIPFNFMQYYQREVGINGPMHSPIDEPVNILLIDRNYILWNGYHRSFSKIINGEQSVKGYVFELIIE